MFYYLISAIYSTRNIYLSGLSISEQKSKLNFEKWNCCNGAYKLTFKDKNRGLLGFVKAVQTVSFKNKKKKMTVIPFLVIHATLKTLSLHIRNGAIWSSWDFVSCCCLNRVMQEKYYISSSEKIA